jgi:hypothetical protein
MKKRDQLLVAMFPNLKQFQTVSICQRSTTKKRKRKKKRKKRPIT